MKQPIAVLPPTDWSTNIALAELVGLVEMRDPDLSIERIKRGREAMEDAVAEVMQKP